MKATVLFSIVIFFYAGFAYAELQQSTVLSSKYAGEVIPQCSRDSPDQFESTWVPTKEQIAELESHLKDVESLNSELCCLPGASVDNVANYYLQYVGIILNGRQLIYINAFHRNWGEPKDWREQPEGICDGGENFWGVLYDPETKQFFDLAFNASP